MHAGTTCVELIMIIYYIKLKAIYLSVYLSICPFGDTDNTAVAITITRLNVGMHVCIED